MRTDHRDGNRAHDQESAAETTGTQHHDSDPGNQGEERWRGSLRTQIGEPPRGGERAPQLAHTWPRSDLAHHREPSQQEVARTDDRHDRDREQHEPSQASEASGRRVCYQSAPLREGSDTILGVQRPRQVQGDASAAAELERVDLSVGNGSGRLRASASNAHATEVSQVPGPGAEHDRRPIPSPSGQEDDCLYQVHQERDRRDPQQSGGRGGDEQRPHPMPLRQGAVPIRRRIVLVVPDPRVGRDQDSSPREPGPPTQVELRRARVTCFVEATEFGEKIGPHEHAGVAHEKDIAHTVVLLLVELVALDIRVRNREAVDGPADLAQNLRADHVNNLGTDDGSVRPIRLFHQHAQRVGFAHHIVVAKQQERRPGNRFDRLIGSSGPAADRHRAHKRRRHDRGHPRAHIVIGLGNDQHREVGIVHVPEPGETRLEVRCRAPGDDHGHDRRDRCRSLGQFRVRGQLLGIHGQE